jgi:hypothetical protein
MSTLRMLMTHRLGINSHRGRVGVKSILTVPRREGNVLAGDSGGTGILLWTAIWLIVVRTLVDRALIERLLGRADQVALRSAKTWGKTCDGKGRSEGARRRLEPRAALGPHGRVADGARNRA